MRPTNVLRFKVKELDGLRVDVASFLKIVSGAGGGWLLAFKGGVPGSGCKSFLTGPVEPTVVLSGSYDLQSGWMEDVTDVDWWGVGSARRWNEFMQMFRDHSEGRLSALVVWERGNAYMLDVVNGVITEKEL